MKTSTLLLGIGGALAAFVIIRRMTPPAKPTAGSAAGQIIDDGKNLIDVLTRRAPLGVPPMGDSPLASAATLGRGAVTDDQGFATLRTSVLQPSAMTRRQRTAAGSIPNSHFRTRGN